MIGSFRLRLALLSAVTSGLALTVFGLGAWWQIRSMRLARLDNDVRIHAERESNRKRDAKEWQRTSENIASEIGVPNGNDALLLVEDSDGNTIYRSPAWPSDLDVQRLPWPKPAQVRPTPDDAPQPGPPERFEDPAISPDDPAAPPRPPRRRDGDADRPPRPDQRNPRREPPGPRQRPASTAISHSVGGNIWRVGLAATNESKIAVAVNSETINAEMAGIRNAFLVAMPFALALIGVGAWTFSSRALRPVRRLTAATRNVTVAGLDQRISVRDEDREFVELIQVFNDMLERLQRSFKQANRFSSDAAHELKTPLAILQGQLEKAIQAAEHGSPIQAELIGILDEVRRLSAISGKLLLLSQADAGRLNLHRESVDLSRVLAELAEDTRMLAPHLTVDDQVPSGLVISADGTLLRQVLHNLISNAIKYNVNDGWIRISAANRGNHVDVCIANSSPGIPASERERIFDRFYRADSAHDRRVEGVGLGLSVSREIARAHGGDIKLKMDEKGVAQFCLVLPCRSNRTTPL